MCATHALITAHFLNKCGLGLYRINYKLTIATLFFVAFGGSGNESALADAWMLARKKRQKQAFLLRRKSSTPRHHQPEYTAWVAFRSPLKSATSTGYFETVMAQVAFVQDEAVWETFGKCGRWSIRVLCTQEKTGSNSVFVSSSIINVFWRTDRGHCTRSRGRLKCVRERYFRQSPQRGCFGKFSSARATLPKSKNVEREQNLRSRVVAREATSV